ncbi:ras-related protein Rab-9A-like [Babylonia areolata]|uniref:ras-related protein Rab-9A-like n=1 Tax=Babylonia areolata TaxID=304850 RepID=UPI003FD44BF2
MSKAAPPKPSQHLEHPGQKHHHGFAGGRKSRRGMGEERGCRRRLRVVLLGDMRVGKTSLLSRFVQGRFDPRVHRTIAIEEMEKEVTVDDERYVLRVVDTCGGERFRSLRQNFYRGTHVCLLTFALDNLSSFCNLTMWREEFLYYSDVPLGCEFPFLVIGNKADLPDHERAVSDLNANAWCRANGDVPYFETSAKEALNVEEVFTAAVRQFQEVASRNAGSDWLRRSGGMATLAGHGRPGSVIRDLRDVPAGAQVDGQSSQGGCCR